MIENIKVVPMCSSRSGDAVRNQYAIKCGNYVAFQSYDSLIAVYDCNTETLTIGRYYNYSRTTSKYLKEWMYDYVRHILYKLTVGKSFSDSLQKAIDTGLIKYDNNMR